MIALTFLSLTLLCLLLNLQRPRPELHQDPHLPQNQALIHLELKESYQALN